MPDPFHRTVVLQHFLGRSGKQVMVLVRRGESKSKHFIRHTIQHIPAHQVKRQAAMIVGYVDIVFTHQFRSPLHPFHVCVTDFNIAKACLISNEKLVREQAQ